MVDVPDVLPALATRDIVAFPSVVMSLYVARESTIHAVEHADETERCLFVVAQRESSDENVAGADVFDVGVVCRLLRSIRLPDGQLKVLLHGMFRAKVKDWKQTTPVLLADCVPLLHEADVAIGADEEAMMYRIRENLQFLAEHEQIPEEMLVIASEIEDPRLLADLVIAHYQLDIPRAQQLLEMYDYPVRLSVADELITNELSQVMISENIQERVREELSKDQRDYFLREQLKQIQKELGEEPSGSEDLEEIKVALDLAGLPEHARREADKQLVRLERMGVESSEYALIRTYLEWVADLPWSVRSEEQLDIHHAAEILERDHYGLPKVKERILEYLAVRKLKENPRGPILCFVGPPGVGKTSLGKSIAAALGRKFYRMSLGGVRDEAEIRGHRRTYVGALPGRVLQGMKQAGSKNPVFVLDELDKIGADFRGDPAAALLEVLDPAQNKQFVDHYLNIDFDLSEVLFVATANTTDTIPEALLDRLEVIRISGYTNDEKLHICEQHLVPRQLDEVGLGPAPGLTAEIAFEKSALLFLIEYYTREAGVRNLEREIGSVLRKIARAKAEGQKLRRRISKNFVESALGPTRFDRDFIEKNDAVGLVRGLAWTTGGGEMLPIEVSLAKGNGNLTLTGHLGNIMQESARTALFYVRASAAQLGLDPDFARTHDVHIHAPGGAIPKDGPSAGIAIATALVSALSNQPVRSAVAMTGEMTLRGNVLSVGGIREKALAALRYGIRKVILPYENLKDLQEIPKEQREQITFVPVKHVHEALQVALRPAARVIHKKPIAKKKPSNSKVRGPAR
jgi:ATP-dependent Lon protease